MNNKNVTSSEMMGSHIKNSFIAIIISDNMDVMFHKLNILLNLLKAVWQSLVQKVESHFPL